MSPSLCRRYSLSGISLDPNWIPLVSITSAENQLQFDLQLMTGSMTLKKNKKSSATQNVHTFNSVPVFTDTWDFRRGVYSYFLGDPVYFEVSATPLHHVPLRVYVDHCVATATPDVDAPVRYDFIENSG